jgi:hypothetical protein
VGFITIAVYLAPHQVLFELKPINSMLSYSDLPPHEASLLIFEWGMSEVTLGKIEAPPDEKYEIIIP